MSLNTHKLSELLRTKAIDLVGRKILVTNFLNTTQEKDFSEPANCNGFGRIRHFRRIGSDGWPLNPLPIDPAANKLRIPREDMALAQVFQNSACNWRCWYCFVPFELLAANDKLAGWLSAADLIDFYLKEPARPKIIDLTGGQPDLTPEWIPWMMRELLARGLQDSVYLWSDDNLSNDYFWRYLSTEEINLVRNYPKYGKVCCFKGFNTDSFCFNTKAEPALFDQQFQLFARYLELGIDLYGYATFTAQDDATIEADMSNFVDRLQELDANLPLRIIPLEIRGSFTPVRGRMHAEHQLAIKIQWQAIECWKTELERRFSSESRNRPIYENPLLRGQIN
jgi:uncharacterized Fe-S cluster-containing radical SAM superfamily protein